LGRITIIKPLEDIQILYIGIVLNQAIQNKGVTRSLAILSGEIFQKNQERSLQGKLW